jgi:two-component system, chemotaxis family, response regulator WspF
MKIAIVNDVQLEIDILKKSLINYQGYEIAWTAISGREAIEKYNHDKVDLILMNMNMPIMDGAATTKAIMEILPVAVLIVTSSVKGNQGKVFEAMGYGALDVVSTPTLSPKGKLIGADEIIKKIDVFKKLINYHHTLAPNKAEVISGKKERNRLVAIGSSTGGPKALSQIIEKLPINIQAAVVIVQHVDSQFANGLAEWLKNYTKIPITLAENGKSPENGNIYIASTNDHLYLNKQGAFEYSPMPIENHFRPSVDVFFQSLKDNWIYNDTAILLTGMGNDGAKGLKQLLISGWHTIAQDEATSVVYGMPKAAKEIGAAKEILAIQNIADSIIRNINCKEN